MKEIDELEVLARKLFDVLMLESGLRSLAGQCLSKAIEAKERLRWRRYPDEIPEEGQMIEARYNVRLGDGAIYRYRDKYAYAMTYWRPILPGPEPEEQIEAKEDKMRKTDNGWIEFGPQRPEDGAQILYIEYGSDRIRWLDGYNDCNRPEIVWWWPVPDAPTRYPSEPEEPEEPGILPCPRCGEMPILTRWDESSEWTISCSCTAGFKTRAEAIEAANRRVKQ